MMMNDSPVSREVHKMTDTQLDKEVSAIAGRNGKWTSDVSKIFELIEELDALKHPRYFAKTQSGAWTVREHYTKDPLARADTLPTAVCRALVIITKGKGQYFSEAQKCGSKSSSTSTGSSRTSRRATASSTKSKTRSRRIGPSGVTKRGTSSNKRG